MHVDGISFDIKLSPGHTFKKRLKTIWKWSIDKRGNEFDMKVRKHTICDNQLQ